MTNTSSSTTPYDILHIKSIVSFMKGYSRLKQTVQIQIFVTEEILEKFVEIPQCSRERRIVEHRKRFLVTLIKFCE